MYVTLPSDHLEPAFATRVTSRPFPRAVRTFQPGTSLFRDGDEADHVYQILGGVLRLTKVMENGRRQVIAFGYPGDVVGFPCEGLHHSDCDVLSTATIVAHRVSVLEDGREAPELHARLMQAVLREIGSMQDHFLMLGRKSALEKLASFLCALDDRTGGADTSHTDELFLPMSRSDIADFLGLTNETVSRTFSALRRKGVIAMEDPHCVTINDRTTLRDLAEGSDA